MDNESPIAPDVVSFQILFECLNKRGVPSRYSQRDRHYHFELLHRLMMLCREIHI